MNIERISRLLKEPEGLTLEFKESHNKLPGNIFETVCAMLNREGGDILLGVSDDGKLYGIDRDKKDSIISNLVNLSNNSQKLNPPFILFPQKHLVENKWIIHIQVPCSSQVHKTNNVVFDRSNDGDFKVDSPVQIAELYNRKRTHYTEGSFYPAVRFEDFNPDLFPKVKNLIRSNNINHPWLALNDQQMLEKAGLWKRDFQTGKEAYTLAAILLFGKDEIIQQILPHYKIDALVRRENLKRYDDRDYIQTNLIEAYERLMNFAARHLPDRFYMEDDQRISLLTKIIREIAANVIVHREYTNAQPATFIIYKDRIEVENANNPHGKGPISLDNFTPFPKNPLISKFFIQLGWVDELGSGIINVNKYLSIYSSGNKPQFIEGISFKTIIPLDEKLYLGHTVIAEGTTEGAIKGAIEGATGGATGGVRQKIKDLLMAMIYDEGKKVKDYIQSTGIPKSSAERYIKMLREADFIEFKGEAPQTGGYYLTESFKKKLNKT